jgi:hypothetical protein
MTVFQYSPAAWALRLSLINAQLGTSYTTAQWTVAMANASVAGAFDDYETVRVIQSEFGNLVNLRNRLAGLFGTASTNVTHLTAILQALQADYADYIPVVPPITLPGG